MSNIFETKEKQKLAVALAVVVGVLTGFILFNYTLGINYFIITCVVLGITYWVLKDQTNFKHGIFIVWSGVLLLYASVFFRVGNEIYRVYSFLMVPCVYALLTVYSLGESSDKLLQKASFRLFAGIGDADKLVKTSHQIMKEENKNQRTIISIVVGVIISAALMCIILPLLFSADSAFEQVVSDIVNFDKVITFLGRCIVTFISSSIFFGYMYFYAQRRLFPKVRPKHEQVKKQSIFTEAGLLLTVLIMIGIVFTAFAAVQFNYLFIGVSEALPGDYDYAEYARSGYFEQVFLSIFNFCIIMGMVQLSDKLKNDAKRIISGGLTYFNLLNVYLMVSAGYKMYLYQQEYGSTQLRLLVYILLVFELILLALQGIKIINRSFKWINLAVPVTVFFWAAVTFINIEAISVQQNIKLYEEGKDFDGWYVSQLSSDACGEAYKIYNRLMNEIHERAEEKGVPLNQLYISQKEPIQGLENYFYGNGLWEYDNDCDATLSFKMDIEEFKQLHEGVEERIRKRKWPSYNSSEYKKQQLVLQLLAKME